MENKEQYIKWIIIGASLLTVIAAFLPWVTSRIAVAGTNLDNPSTIMSGIRTQLGYVNIVCGVLALGIWYWKKSKAFTIIFGSVVLIVSALFWFYIIKVVPSMTVDLKSSAGIGLYLSMLASIVLITAAILYKRNAQLS